MNCCNSGEPAAPAITTPTKRRPWLRRIRAATEWALPFTVLALIPKCPACVAAYILLFTGVGLSLPAAAATRWALISLCIASIAFLLFRAARRAFVHLA